MGRGRLATAVVVDREGSPRGAFGPAQLPTPWWQETEPLAELIPDGVVLRLLDAEPDEHEPMGGRVTYLVETEADLELTPWSGRLEPHPLRLPWAEVGGPSADLAWVASVVEVAGRPRQHRTWNLSAIWSIPTTEGLVWLKCVPPFFAHEADVLDVLSGPTVPRLLAADGHRLLLASMDGDDGYGSTEAEQLEMVAALVALQVAAIDRVDELVRRGAPDLRGERLTTELALLVDRVAPQSRSLAALVDELPDRLDVAGRLGPPDTLVHGDPHDGNCRRGADPPVWFDWGDSFVGNPLLDLAAIHRMCQPAVDRWLDLWEDAVPGSDPRRAWRELAPVAKLRMAWVYQRFLDNIEPSERVYHRDDVPMMLAEAEAMLAGVG